MFSIILPVAVLYGIIVKIAFKKSFFFAFGQMMLCGIAATFATVFTYAYIYTV